MELTAFLETLNLGIYEKQVIVYLASVSSADAKLIYKNTKVPKGRIYSVLQRLQELGFVNVLPTSPKKYRIKNIKGALRQYFNNKKSVLDEKLKTIDKLELKPKQFNINKNNPSVFVFSGREEHLNAIISFRESAKKELMQVAPLFKGSFASNLSLQRALSRGVKVRIIVLKLTKENKKNIAKCIKSGGKVRQINSPNLLSMLIKDSSEFLLGVQNYGNNEERMTIFSKNKALLDNLKETFNSLWKKARPIP